MAHVIGAGYLGQRFAVRAPPEASMPIRQGGNWAMNGSTFCRASRFFTTTCPRASTPWMHTTFLAISIPTVVTCAVVTCAMVDPPVVKNGCRSHNHRALYEVMCTVGGSIPLRSLL